MIKIKTSKLKEMMNKSIKGAGSSTVVVLTSMLGIKVDNNRFRLITSDVNTTTSVITNDVEGDLDVSVNVDIFSKLVGKLTSDETKLSVEDNTLVVKANGTYKIPLIVDENGIVSIDEPNDIQGEESEIPLSDIKSIRNFSKISLSENSDYSSEDYLFSYYCGLEDTTITNGFVATFNKKSIIKDNPMLIPTKVIDLICLSSDDKVKLIKSNNSLQFVSSDIIITSKGLHNSNEYPITNLKSVLDTEFKYSGKIDCDDYISTIDRLRLFIDPYDDDELVFDFYCNFVKITNKNNSSYEELKLQTNEDTENYLEFSCKVNATEFIKALSSVPASEVDIYYGNDSVIKIDCGSIVHIISLSQDDEEEE